MQNIVVRDYAARNAFDYKLSAVKYAMPGCYLMLETVLDELPRLEGIICYSVFQLPGNARRRHEVYRRVLDSGASLHGAVESIACRRRRMWTASRMSSWSITSPLSRPRSPNMAEIDFIQALHSATKRYYLDRVTVHDRPSVPRWRRVRA